MTNRGRAGDQHTGKQQRCEFHSKILVPKRYRSFQYGSFSGVVVTPWLDEVWMNLSSPIKMPECVISQLLLYVLTKKTRSPGMSISFSAIILPYLACSSELCGSNMPYVAKTLNISPEQSMHFAVVPPMQCGTPRYPRAVSMISSGVAVPEATERPIPAFMNCSSRFISD